MVFIIDLLCFWLGYDVYYSIFLKLHEFDQVRDSTIYDSLNQLSCSIGISKKVDFKQIKRNNLNISSVVGKV